MPRFDDPQTFQRKLKRLRWRIFFGRFWLAPRALVGLMVAVLAGLAILYGLFSTAATDINFPRQKLPSTTITPAPNVKVIRHGGQAQPALTTIEVVDGDTVRSGGAIYRLVGFDTPEGGMNAKCERERTLAARATQRLRLLVAGGGVNLRRVPCACPQGTESTPRCNLGRLCGTLTVRGSDVAGIMIGEGLARPYFCGSTSCPPRGSWC